MFVVGWKNILSIYSTFSASKASLYERVCGSGGASTVETMTMAFKTPGALKSVLNGSHLEGHASGCF